MHVLHRGRSDEIQSVVRPAKKATTKHAPLKKNPLKNLGVMMKLNPYAKVRYACMLHTRALTSHASHWGREAARGDSHVVLACRRTRGRCTTALPHSHCRSR